MPSASLPDYPFLTSDHERQRLMRQADILSEATERLLRKAGIGYRGCGCWTSGPVQETLHCVLASWLASQGKSSARTETKTKSHLRIEEQNRWVIKMWVLSKLTFLL